jgi:probable rRNA maturation factor
MPIAITAPLSYRKSAPALRTLITQTLRGESRRVGEIAVVLTDDEALRELNRGWRGIDRATDVISFAYNEYEPDAATRPVTGDLVISIDRVREQAKRYKVTEGAELARLVIHGALHLGGHDHQDAGEREVMRVSEELAMKAAKALIRKLEAAWPKAAKPAKVAKPAPRKQAAKPASRKKVAKAAKPSKAAKPAAKPAPKRTAKKKAARRPKKG